MGNLQQQAEQVPQLTRKAERALERIAQGGPARERARQPRLERLLGALLLLGAASQGLAANPETWPAWAMLAGGLYLILRR